MSLMRYNSWPTVAHWHSDLDSLFDPFVRRAQARHDNVWQPRVDIYEFDDRFELSVDLPGVDPAAVDIRLKDGLLEITGERAAAAPSEDAENHRRERPQGQFRRSFQLPDSAETDGITAQSNNGVIQIQVPKRTRSQEVKVQVAA